MNTEIISFFDNPDLMTKVPSLWQTLNQEIYDVILVSITRMIALYLSKIVIRFPKNQNN